MTCPACGNDYNHLTDSRVVGRYCSRVCSNLAEETLRTNGLCVHGRVGPVCIECAKHKREDPSRVSDYDRVILIMQALHKRMCGDSSCIYGRPGGQMTNGGCSTLKQDNPQLRRELQNLVTDLRWILTGTYFGTPGKEEKSLPEGDRFGNLEIE